VAQPRAQLTVDGVELAVHDSDPASSKPAIVCLHAIGHGGGDFAAFEATFSARYRVITVDWPGQGASGVDPQPASAKRYEALLAGLLDALKLERAVVFGNSIGGAAAIRYAQAHPERVRALILCNPGGLDPGGILARFFINHLVSRFERGVAGEARFHDWFADYYADVLPSAEATARREAIVAAGYESAPRLVEAWQSFAQPDADLRAGLGRLSMPVFVGWAMKDALVQYERNREALEALPHGTVVKFERSGHAPFLEEPAAFNAAVEPFLAALR
jgi:4,5:9,10-diseco-3-hydroxy-5,9,17-trioxoandrosta-1(10),2-diene-4-oate hydrolase